MLLVRLVITALVGLVLLLAIGIGANGVPLRDPPGILVRIATYLNVHEARTSGESAFPELRPRYYAHGPSVLFAKVREAAAALPRWVVVESDPGRRVVHAVVASAIFGFEDDVVITVVPEPMRPVVQVRARSRVGRGDLGANTRHILDLYTALETLGLRGEPAPRPGA